MRRRVGELEAEARQLTDDYAKQMTMTNEERGAELQRLLTAKDTELMAHKLQAVSESENFVKKLADQLQVFDQKLTIKDDEIVSHKLKIVAQSDEFAQKLADQQQFFDQKLADELAAQSRILADEIAKRDQRLSDGVIAQDNDIEEEVLTRKLVEQVLAAKEAELKDVLSRNPDLTEVYRQLDVAKAELKEQAGMYKGQLVTLSESGDAALKAAKKKKIKELKRKDAEKEEEGKKHMAQLIVFQDELDAEKSKVQILEDKITALEAK